MTEGPSAPFRTHHLNRRRRFDSAFRKRGANRAAPTEKGLSLVSVRFSPVITVRGRFALPGRRSSISRPQRAANELQFPSCSSAQPRALPNAKSAARTPTCRIMRLDRRRRGQGHYLRPGQDGLVSRRARQAESMSPTSHGPTDKVRFVIPHRLTPLRALRTLFAIRSRRYVILRHVLTSYFGPPPAQLACPSRSRGKCARRILGSTPRVPTVSNLSTVRAIFFCRRVVRSSPATQFSSPLWHPGL